MWAECNGVQVSDTGEVMLNGVELKQYQTKSGYKQVKIEKKLVYVHRLVAIAFVQNDDGKPYVNHKDGNKVNNRAGNLEWVTASENTAHAHKIGLFSKYKCVSCGRELTATSKHDEKVCGKCKKEQRRIERLRNEEIQKEKAVLHYAELAKIADGKLKNKLYVDVLKFLSSGSSIRDVAKAFGISRPYVYHVIQYAEAKTGLHD